MENLEGIFPIISEHPDSKFSGGVRFSKTAQSTTSQRFVRNYEGKDAI